VNEGGGVAFATSELGCLRPSLSQHQDCVCQHNPSMSLSPVEISC
jgi:hypothetical protein